MKQKLMILLSLCLATTMAQAEQVVLQTKNTTMERTRVVTTA